MRKRKNNMQDVANARTSKEIENKTNRLFENVIIIKTPNFNSTKLSLNSFINAEYVAETTSSSSKGKQNRFAERTVNPNAILAGISKPKRKLNKNKRKNAVADAKTMKIDEFDELKNNLQSVFTGYRHMTKEKEKELNRMGFYIKRKRKHLILVLSSQGNTYSFAISMSASDKKCGHKIVSTIMNKIRISA